MAKARQALSLWKGRAGGIVYSELNGNQIMRTAPSSVSNPKTDAQVMQRMKLAPAATFYRLLEGLVPLGFASHTFQGKKYGNNNRLRFMQLAMLNNQGPYVPKDYNKFVPFDYQISEGSLPSLTARVHVADNGTLPSTAVKVTVPETLTAEQAEQFADAFGINVGDQLSFLVFGYITGSDSYRADVQRVVITEGAKLKAALDDLDIVLYNTATGGTADIASVPFGGLQIFIDSVAGAVVTSRKQTNGTFLRSSEWIVISNDIRDEFYTPNAMQAAIDSYNGTNTNGSGSPFYNNLGDSAFDGTIYASPMKLKYEDTVRTEYIFWGKNSAGNKILFTSNGRSDGWLVNVSERGWDSSIFRMEDIVTSAQWAGIAEWLGDVSYSQWESGQKAVKPMPYVAIDEQEDEVNP